MQQARNLVEVVSIHSRDNRALFHVREQRNLARLFRGERVLRSAQQDVRLDTNATQFLHGMLSRLRLDFTASDHGHEREVHVDAIVAAQLNTQLANGLEERQGLDVAHRATNFHHADVGIASA